MQNLSTSEVREHFSDILNQVAFGKERLIFERRGKGIVAMIPIEDLKLLEFLEDQADREEAKALLKNIHQEKTYSLESVKEELGL